MSSSIEAVLYYRRMKAQMSSLGVKSKDATKLIKPQELQPQQKPITETHDSSLTNPDLNRTIFKA